MRRGIASALVVAVLALVASKAKARGEHALYGGAEAPPFRAQIESVPKDVAEDIFTPAGGASPAPTAEKQEHDQSHGQGGTITVDGIAARIEGDIVTESQLNELAGFQRLVDGKASSRADLLRELTDQWIVNTEASTVRFSRPKSEDVTQAYDDLAKRYPSATAFQTAIADSGLTVTAVRRQLELQIFLEQFIEYKFRTGAQVSENQIQDYYNGEFTKEAKARGESVPPLEDVHADIRRLLTERAINVRAGKWLDDTRSRLRVDIVALPNKS
jgi:hypothetical protein